MLVLSRRTDESVVLVNNGAEPLIIQPGEKVASVMVAYVRGNRVGIGFDAPPAISITRAELRTSDSDGVLARKAN